MSLYFLEGFGAYATGAHANSAGEDMKLQWLTWTDPMQIAAMASGSQGVRNYLYASASDDSIAAYPDLNGFNSATIVVGFRFYFEPETQGGLLFTFYDTSTTLGHLMMTSNGQLQYYAYTQASLNYAAFTSTSALRAYSWNYVEAKIYFHSSAGTVDFRINGAAAGSYTGVDTIYSGGSMCDTLRIGYNDLVDWRPSYRMTDIYVDDADFHGPMEIWYQNADTAGSAANFTPSTGSNYQNVDEYGADNDTTYNYSTAPTNLDQIAHSDTLAVAPLVIHPMVMARYVPTGSGNLKVGIKSGATHDQDAAAGLSDTYGGVKGKFYVTDPNTASAWTSGNADAAETTYEHVA